MIDEITDADIRALLPHRPPMLLVDSVMGLVAGHELWAVRTISTGEPWTGHQAGGAYPWALVLESWCQAASLLAAWDLRDSPDLLTHVPLFGAVAKARFGTQPRVGDVLDHRVRLVRALSDTWIFEGETFVGSQTVLSVDRATVALRPAGRLGASGPGGPGESGAAESAPGELAPGASELEEA